MRQIPFNGYISCAFMIWAASCWPIPACKDCLCCSKFKWSWFLLAGASSERNRDRSWELGPIPPGKLQHVPKTTLKATGSLGVWNGFVRAAWTCVPNCVLLQSACYLDSHGMPSIVEEENSYMLGVLLGRHRAASGDLCRPRGRHGTAEAAL